MKNRFTTLDIKATICELNQRFLGMRVANVYDIDNRTYLIKLAMPDKKAVILLESGNRIHSTEFEWPKGMMPSGFSMKLRKHLRTRRLESIQQLGADRIVDLQFGSGEAAYHVILELYDRGNIVLTDHEYTILNLLRQRTDQDTEVRFAVRETYPVETAKQHDGVPTEERLRAIFQAAREGDNLKRILNPHLVYGPAVIEHCLVEAGLPSNAKLAKDFVVDRDMPKLLVAMENAENILQSAGKSKGYIIQKREKRVTLEEGEPQKELLTYEEFHPMLFKQHEHLPYAEFETFDKAVDEYFSQLGSQKLDNKLLQQEKSALKKLENVKKDHEKRLSALQHEQATDTQKGQLIEMNLSLVDRAIQIVCSALANQIDWGEISNLVKEAQLQKDPVACAIINLSLHTNHITMLLRDPYANSDDEEEETDDDVLKPLKVTIDLALSAHGNARKYFDMKKHAAVKEQKTMDASEKALKSAEKKTKQTLKEVQTVATINKARKTYWFEKFLWFITSENYLVVGGRDQQQNEIIVKRYLKPGDLYVHADLHGASSCILKNPTGEEVPPKTLNEAGTMAICNSAAWDAKVVTSAWWVHHHQVSKTAPTGEYLSTGSFMVRGKKNYLPPSYLIYGFGILFKVDEESIFRHKGERKVRTIDDESVPDTADAQSEVSESTEADDVEVKGSDSDSSDEETEAKTQATGEADTEMATKTETETLESETTVKDEGEVEDIKVEPTEDVKEEKAEVQFPDTSISLQHVKGDKYSLQRHHSSMSASSHHSYEDDEENIVYLGDDQPVLLAPSQPQQSATARLSAKQRRDMKKKAKHQQQVEEVQSESKPTEEEAEPTGEPMPPAQNQQKDNEPGPAPAKRGQKAKMKKMQKKYADQDEEERQRRMEILASAGGPKEDKKKNKKSKQKQQQQQQKQQQQQQQQQGKQGSQQGRAHSSKSVPQKGKLTIDDIKVETLSMEGKQEVEKAEGAMGGDDRGEDSDEEKQAILEEENIQITSDADILDSLTGLPVPEDMLMFAIPVCAPYQSLTNYKYKVKLLPGTTKRGKAAKAALNMFMHDKNMTQREKDLFKSLKDVDQARNMPGKVKVAAPNLQKSKGKR